MSYIGNQPTNTAFLINTFSGNSVTTSFTLSVAPATANAILVTIGGILQDISAYGVVGRILTFSGVPPTGTNNISVRFLGLPASNVTTPAYRTVTDLTATAGQTTFSTAGYTPGFIDVYRNGVKLAAADFTATNGAQVVLVNPAILGDTITTISFFVSSVANAIPGISGSVTPSYLDISGNGGTGAVLLPAGTTAQRPASPVVGMQRWNTTISAMEVFIGNATWQSIASSAYAVEVLIVAGGGGGGLHSGGGGGAGGLLYYGAEVPKTPNGPALLVSPTTSYAITVGAGGAGSGGPYQSVAGGGANGNNSFFGVYTAIAGGGGGAGGNSVNGKDGGSGGGGGRDRPGGVATTGQGFGGGYIGSVSPNYPGGGGGGAGGVGSSGTTGAGGTGGNGLAYSISGSSTYYAGGGGGNLQDSADSVPTQGAGGLGGGANGRNTGGVGNAGGANTGGGGGANNYNTAGGGPGGSGIVIIRYFGSQRGAGGIVSSASGYTIHTFTSSGSFTA